jgi:hypothetical protein
MSKVTKGFKAMDKNMTCLGHKFEVGNVYETKSLKICSTGFHFCENAFDVYSYYPKTSDTIVCEIEALGEVQKEGDKSVTNKIKIVKRLTEKELLNLWINRRNSGDWNSGYGNSGNRNSGNRNSGNRNSGNRNSGDGNSGYGNSGNRNSGNRNSGDWNSGYGNSGNRNSGNRNSGDWNSGYGNSGNRNSGDWNSGDGNSGYFNTKVPLYFFNQPSELEYTEVLSNKMRSLNVKPIVQWIGESLMNDTEKQQNPSYKVTGGFLRKTDRHDFSQLTKEDKDFIKSLPNFNNEIFKQITKVDLENDGKVKVSVNGVDYMVDIEKAKELGLIK